MWALWDEKEGTRHVRKICGRADGLWFCVIFSVGHRCMQSSSRKEEGCLNGMYRCKPVNPRSSQPRSTFFPTGTIRCQHHPRTAKMVLNSRSRDNSPNGPESRPPSPRIDGIPPSSLPKRGARSRSAPHPGKRGAHGMMPIGRVSASRVWLVSLVFLCPQVSASAGVAPVLR